MRGCREIYMIEMLLFTICYLIPLFFLSYQCGKRKYTDNKKDAITVIFGLFGLIIWVLILLHIQGEI